MQQIADLLTIETEILRGIFDTEGEAAFDRAARRLLFHTAALIANAAGPQRLRDLMAAVEIAQPIQ